MYPFQPSHKKVLKPQIEEVRRLDLLNRYAYPEASDPDCWWHPFNSSWHDALFRHRRRRINRSVWDYMAEAKGEEPVSTVEAFYVDLLKDYSEDIAAIRAVNLFTLQMYDDINGDVITDLIAQCNPEMNIFKAKRLAPVYVAIWHDKVVERFRKRCLSGSGAIEATRKKRELMIAENIINPGTYKPEEIPDILSVEVPNESRVIDNALKSIVEEKTHG